MPAQGGGGRQREGKEERLTGSISLYSFIVLKNYEPRVGEMVKSACTARRGSTHL